LNLKTHTLKLIASLASLLPARLAQHAETLSALLQGKGAGSGWDLRSEARAAARIIHAQSPVIIDAGAHTGQWTLYLAGRLLRKGRTPAFHLFEPSPHNASLLRARRWPHGARVHVQEAALGKENTTLPFYEPTPGSLLSALHPRTDSFLGSNLPPAASSNPVQVVSLDSWAEQNSICRIDYLKLDIEGHELEALRGASGLISRKQISVIAFEFGSANVATRTFFRDFWDFFQTHGFYLSRIAPGGFLVPILRYEESHEYFRGASNYICRLFPR
jgi:FkbM family methyltransferase